MGEGSVDGAKAGCGCESGESVVESVDSISCVACCVGEFILCVWEVNGDVLMRIGCCLVCVTVSAV